MQVWAGGLNARNTTSGQRGEVTSKVESSTKKNYANLLGKGQVEKENGSPVMALTKLGESLTKLRLPCKVSQKTKVLGGGGRKTNQKKKKREGGKRESQPKCLL